MAELSPTPKNSPVLRPLDEADLSQNPVSRAPLRVSLEIIRWGVLFALLCLVLFLGGEMRMSVAGVNVFYFWPAVGLALAIALFYGLPSLLLLGAAYGAAAFLLGQPVGPVTISFLSDVACVAVASLLLNRTGKSVMALENIGDTFRFLMVGPLLGGAVGAAVFVAGHLLFRDVAGDWVLTLFVPSWLGSGLGILVTTPLFLVWRGGNKIRWRNSQLLEVTAWLGVLITVAVSVFGNWAPSDTLAYPLELAIFPLMAWAAVRFGQRGTTVGMSILSLLAVMELHRVFELDQYISQPPVYLWVFVGVVACTSYFLAAVVTEMRQREEETSLNEGRLRAFIDALPDVAFIISEEGRYIDVFYPRDTGPYSDLSSLKGKDFSEVWSKVQAAAFNEAVKDTLKSGKTRTLEYQIDSIGRKRWFEGRISPMAAPDGRLDRVIWVAYEITERKIASAALEHRDQLLQGVAEASALLLSVTERDEALKKALGLLGKHASVDRVLLFESGDGNSVAEREVSVPHHWTPDGTSARINDWLTDSKLWERVLPGWLDNISRRGTLALPVDALEPRVQKFFRARETESLLVVPVWVEHRFWGAVTLERCWQGEWEDSDVTALQVASSSLGAFLAHKQSEEALRRAKDAADAANSAKSEFLAMMSHEIRTPMNAILGFTDILAQTQMTDAQRDSVNVINRSGKGLLELINNILDFSKIESRGIDLENVPFNLETTVVEALEMMLVKARQKKGALHYEMSGHKQGMFNGDSHRLRQVMLNLVNNAVKFTDEGEVRVRIDVQPSAVRGGFFDVGVDVVDTGIGIASEKLDKLFQPFSQVDSSTTRQYGGTGLGLVICKRLIERMGGAISVESEEGKGSRFYFFIQLEALASGKKEPRQTVDAGELEADFASRNPLRILTVEDDAVNQKLFRQLFGGLGYDIEIAGDAATARKILAEKEFDAIMMDVQLPDMSGLEITDLIRKGAFGPVNPKIFIAAMTAFALPEDRRKCLDAGCNDYISKPVETPKLKRTLARAANELKQR